MVSDTVGLVAIKSNILIPRASGHGIITDAPQAKILIAEGVAGLVDPARQDCTGVEIREATVWRTAG